jgi:hypothetical protein
MMMPIAFLMLVMAFVTSSIMAGSGSAAKEDLPGGALFGIHSKWWMP